jgi:hypothetical protein
MFQPLLILVTELPVDDQNGSKHIASYSGHLIYRIFRYIKRSKFVKNEYARYTVEYFLVDNACVIYT